MTEREYRRMTLAQLKGRKVRTVVAIRNGYGWIEEGTILTITDKRAGLSLENADAYITRVKPWDVALLPEATPDG